MTCEEVDDEEVYPLKLSSAVFLKITSDEEIPTANSDLPSESKEELQISFVDHFSPKEEESETVESESEPHPEQSTSDLPKEISSLSLIPPSHKPKIVAVQEWLSQPDETSSASERKFSNDNGDEPTLWEQATKSTAPNEEASLASDEEIPWYDRISSSPGPEEEFPDYDYDGTTFSEEEEESADLPYEMQPATLEAKQKLEAALPDLLKRMLGLPISPVAEPVITPPAKLPELPPTTEATGLRDAIRALNRWEKLRGHQRKQLRLLNEELTWRESLGINLDLLFIKGRTKEQLPKKEECLWWKDERVQRQIL